MQCILNKVKSRVEWSHQPCTKQNRHSRQLLPVPNPASPSILSFGYGDVKMVIGFNTEGFGLRTQQHRACRYQTYHNSSNGSIWKVLDCKKSS